MTEFLILACVLLGLNLALSLFGMLHQPTDSDRMLSAQLLGTNGVGLMILLAVSQELTALIDVALVLALLAAVVVIAFTRKEEASHD